MSDLRRRRDRPRGPRPAGAAVGDLAAALQPRSALAQVQRVWADAVGDLVAAQAEPTGERAGVLTVTCASAVWAQELDLMGPDLVARLNAALGTEVVRGLRCQAAPARSWGRG